MNRKANQFNPAKSRTELYFEQIPRANEDLAEYQWKLKKAGLRAFDPAAPSGMANTRVQVSAGPDAAFIRKLENRDRLALQLSGRIHLLRGLVSQASGLVDRYTGGREKKILTLRYLKGFEWLQVSDEVDGLSPKQLRRVARSGMAKIILPEDAIWIERYNQVA